MAEDTALRREFEEHMSMHHNIRQGVEYEAPPMNVQTSAIAQVKAVMGEFENHHIDNLRVNGDRVHIDYHIEFKPGEFMHHSLQLDVGDGMADVLRDVLNANAGRSPS